MLELSLRYFKEPVIDSQNVPPLGATKQTITLEEASLCDQAFQSGQASSCNNFSSTHSSIGWYEILSNNCRFQPTAGRLTRLLCGQDVFCKLSSLFIYFFEV